MIMFRPTGFEARHRHATAHVAVCGEGDTLLVPSNWFHYAISLTPSITLMRNFFNDVNFQPFLTEWNAKAAEKAAKAAAAEAAQAVAAVEQS